MAYNMTNFPAGYNPMFPNSTTPVQPYYNPASYQKQEVIHVNGEAGANAFSMGPNIPPQQTPIKTLMDTVRSARNPNAMLSLLAKQNPALGTVMQLVQKSGGDPKKAFYELAAQKGVNPEDILSQLR